MPLSASLPLFLSLYLFVALLVSDCQSCLALAQLNLVYAKPIPQLARTAFRRAAPSLSLSLFLFYPSLFHYVSASTSLYLYPLLSAATLLIFLSSLLSLLLCLFLCIHLSQQVAVNPSIVCNIPFPSLPPSTVFPSKCLFLCLFWQFIIHHSFRITLCDYRHRAYFRFHCHFRFRFLLLLRLLLLPLLLLLLLLLSAFTSCSAALPAALSVKFFYVLLLLSLSASLPEHIKLRLFVFACQQRPKPSWAFVWPFSPPPSARCFPLPMSFFRLPVAFVVFM